MTPERLDAIKICCSGEPRTHVHDWCLELIAEVESLQAALIAVGVEVLVDASRQAKVAKSIKERS